MRKFLLIASAFLLMAAAPIMSGSGVHTDVGAAPRFNISVGTVFDFTTGTLPDGWTYTNASDNGVASYFNSSGVMEFANTDAPRFDYIYDGSSWVIGGILLEPQKTNLITYSKALGGTSWTNSGTSIGAKNSAVPTGNTESTLLTNSGDAVGYTFKDISITANTQYTLSVFAKAGTNDLIRLLPNKSGSGISETFDLTNISSTNEIYGSSFTRVAGGIESVGGGWFRCYTTFTDASSASVHMWVVNNSTTSGKTIEVWGAQLSAAPLTAFIPTTSGTVIRYNSVLSRTVPAGMGHWIYTFDDDTTQTVSVSPGATTVDTATLNRPHIKSIEETP